MTQKVEVRSPNANFDLIYKDHLEELYIDGVSTVALGYPFSKLLLHSVAPPTSPEQAGGAENREVVLRLVIPTAALMELALNTLKSASDAKGSIAAAVSAVSGQMSNFLNQLPDLAEVEIKPFSSTNDKATDN